MSKTQVLTRETMDRFEPPRAVVHRMENFRNALGKPSSRCRILDLGCGRGRFVAWLRTRGWCAYGVDIDTVPIRNAESYFTENGWDASKLLRQVSDDGRVPFPDGSFDMVVSNQVLEHVRDLPSILEEIARVTQPGGKGYHVFPAKYRIQEPHILMPLVHWLPKNKLRKAAIYLFSCMGFKPRWTHIRNEPLLSRVNAYYKYSTEKTFYRTVGSIVAMCNAVGMEARIVSGHRSTLAVRPGVGWVVRSASGGAMMNTLLSTFLFVDLETRKSDK